VSSVKLNTLLTGSLLLVGAFFAIFPAASLPFGSPFIVAQLLFVALLPFSLSLRSISTAALASSAVLFMIYSYTFFFFPAPTHGLLYLISAVIFSSNVDFEVRRIEKFSTFALGASLLSVLLAAVFGADRVVFLGGDPNFTAFWLSILMAVFSSSTRYLTRLMAYVCGALIFFTFSRSGLLFLFLGAMYCYFGYRVKFQTRISDRTIFLTATLGSVIISYLVLIYGFKNAIPGYTFRTGLEKFSFESILDISNFIRVKANLFMFDAEFRDLLFGARNPDAVAYDYQGKFIRPHNHFIAMLFEFGVLGTIIIMGQFARKYFWHNRLVLISVVAFSATLGFSYYYGFVLFLLIILSRSRNTGFRKVTAPPNITSRRQDWKGVAT
jgi:hypothetical protein